MPNIIPLEKIENKILLIRGQKVMLDRDLAMLYGVTTKRLNEQVKRNAKRFPVDFMFQLMSEEFKQLVANCDRFVLLKHSSSIPYVFTEQGVVMLSGVLHSDKAIEVNVAIMRVFVNMRKFINSYEGLAVKIAKIEQKYDKKIIDIFKVLDILMKDDKNKKVKEIGFKCD
ncbi:ORF6N domain-containing protein [Candidatus Parcubacteria bacterium]|nr:ORF6N domain-containing protein [Candidatus Parcubacteria bacterium]